MEILFPLISLGLFLGLLALGYLLGKTREKSHIKSLEEREAIYQKVIVTNWKKIPKGYTATNAAFCQGNVVLASDYFKTFIAGIINLGGGRVVTLETLMERARREALIRMTEEAMGFGCNMVLNARFETLVLHRRSRGKNSMPMVEMMAYGTGVTLKKTLTNPGVYANPDEKPRIDQ